MTKKCYGLTNKRYHLEFFNLVACYLLIYIPDKLIFTPLYNRSTNSTHFETIVNVFQTPLHLYATQIISPFLNSKISANNDKSLGFMLLNVPLV
jgi:hypothetical protein